MPKYHSYKNKSGGYMRGRSRSGRFYTKGGCITFVFIGIYLSMIVVFFLL